MTDQGAEDYGIEQDGEKGPGLFLKLSYVIIIIWGIYYFVTYKDWKSSYDLEMQKVNKKLEQVDKK